MPEPNLEARRRADLLEATTMSKTTTYADDLAREITAIARPEIEGALWDGFRLCQATVLGILQRSNNIEQAMAEIADLGPHSEL